MWNIIFLFSGLLFTILIVAVFFVKKKIASKENEIFKLILISSVMAYVVEIPLQLIVRNLGINNYLVDIFAKAYLIAIIIWYALFTIYVFVICLDRNDSNKFDKIMRMAKTAIVIITIIFSIILAVLPMLKYHESDKMYVYGPSVNMLKYFIGAYLFLWFPLLTKNLKGLINKKYLPIYLVIVLLIASTFIQFSDPSILISSMIGTFTCYTMYFTIENPDVRMLEQLNIAKEHAEKANRAKTDFLSSMSHEIRTPLNAIVGFSEMITTEDDMDEIKSEAKDIVMASHTLLEIVNGILDISKIEANKMEIVNKEYELLPELENISKLMVPRIGDKPLELRCKFAEDIPAVMYGDIAKIKEVITNILTNAVKYTDQGHIDFEVSCINEKEQSSLVIKVADTGRGIKKDQIDKLFNKFQRLDEDKNTTIEGTGLGLAITKSLVEMMGGRIIVTSEYGQGSTFTIYLKQKIVKLHKEATVNKFDDRDDYDFSGYKVLVVDDNQLNLKVATKLLTRYNITVETSDSGFDCIDKISKGNTYDLVLLDDMMPRMKGTETLTRLKQNNNYTIPTIALTANAITGMKEHYLSMGFNDYLGKPIEKLELLRVLSKYLKGKKNTEESIEKIEIKEEPSYNDKKILIVDDNKINIKIATKMLEKFNCVLDSAESGQECINKVKNTKYDIIFLDHMMPGMDGITTLGELKKIDGFSTPVIALTAEAIEGSKEKFMEAGFDGYISKPIDRNYLEELVKKILDNKGQ